MISLSIQNLIDNFTHMNTLYIQTPLGIPLYNNTNSVGQRKSHNIKYMNLMRMLVIIVHCMCCHHEGPKTIYEQCSSTPTFTAQKDNKNNLKSFIITHPVICIDINMRI